MSSVWIDVKYINMVSYRLRNFKWVRPGKLANCSCPLCGDSSQDKTKARGYFMVANDRVSYYCHNCNMSLSFSRFLESQFGTEYSEYKLEKFADRQSASTPTQHVDSVDLSSIKFAPKFKPKSFLEENAINLWDLPEDHPALMYIKSRKIKYQDLWYTDNFADIVYQFEDSYSDLVEEPRIIIPYRDYEGNLTGFQGRAMTKTKMRYVTIKKPDTDIIFGLDRVDFTKPVFIFEGALDSTFIPNSLAVNGSSLQRLENLFTSDQLNNMIFCWDCEPRNPTIVRNMETMLKKGRRVVIWKRQVPKDVNEMILSGMSMRELAVLIRDSVQSGAIGLLQLSKWRKV